MSDYFSFHLPAVLSGCVCSSPSAEEGKPPSADSRRVCSKQGRTERLPVSFGSKKWSEWTVWTFLKQSWRQIGAEI